MRKLISLVLAVAAVLPAGASRRVTVAQLEESLAAAALEHRPDSDIARQMGSLELTERLTENTLNRFARLGGFFVRGSPQQAVVAEAEVMTSL
jgi:hypothetical protein